MTAAAFGIALELPRLTVDRSTEHHGLGRPLKRDRDPDELRTVAAEIDLLGRSRKRYGAERAPRNADPSSTVRNQLRLAREMLADEGVLPWAAFERGVLPDNWWRHEATIAAIDLRASDAAWREVHRAWEGAGTSVFSRDWILGEPRLK